MYTVVGKLAPGIRVGTTPSVCRSDNDENAHPGVPDVAACCNVHGC